MKDPIVTNLDGLGHDEPYASGAGAIEDITQVLARRRAETAVAESRGEHA